MSGSGDSHPSGPLTYLLSAPSDFTQAILKSSSLSCTPLLFFFLKSQRRKTISLQRFHLSDHPAKRGQETPPKSKPKTHQRQKSRSGGVEKKGAGERWGAATDCEPKYPGDIFTRCNLLYDAPALVVTQTHALADTRAFSFTQKQAPRTHPHTLSRTHPCNENCR